MTSGPDPTPKVKTALPVSPLKRALRPVDRFLHVESSGGIVLLAFTVVALVLANSPASDWFMHLWETPVELKLGGFLLEGELGHLVINDGLMVIFFFVIGLEIKREGVLGELRDWRTALLPVVAALGGMVAPALVYLSLQWGQPGQGGWTIPMATDIAFVVGIMSLLGRRVPVSLKLFALSLAIADDLGAVLIIAFVFTAKISYLWLAVAVGGLGFTYLLNRVGLRAVPVYAVVGVGVWLAVYKSGVHPTVAGVFLGLLTPTTVWISDELLAEAADDMAWRLRDPHTMNEQNYERTESLQHLEFAAREAISPLTRLETGLHPWVAFVVMPLFALANAGVVVAVSGFTNPVTLAVALGLLVGKPLGIVSFSWLAIKLGWTRLPPGVNWGMLIGAACLAGIGFTMALFLNGLTFPPADPELHVLSDAGKLGTLLGSLASAVLGCTVLVLTTRTPADAPAPEPALAA